METKEQYNLKKRKERWKRRDNKQLIAISELGGKCMQCNLKATIENMCVFDFHHINPNEKEENVSRFITNGRPLNILLTEVRKCILLCSNCHRQLHYNEHLKERQRIINDTN